MKRFLLIASTIVLCATATPGFSAVINVGNFGDGTPSVANAQLAYNAASNGDTIFFPTNGNATWSSSLKIGKPLTIVGNGTTLTAGTTLNTGLFFITGFNSTNLVRITGFTFNLVDFSPWGDAIHVATDVSAGKDVELGNLRIDHNTFRFGYTQIVCNGAKGVIDHNYFYNSRKGIDFSAGNVAQATASWVSMAAGTSDALFIEDNHFVDDASYPVSYGMEKIGTENGGKLVIRYNEFNSDYINPAMTATLEAIQTHGSAPGGVPANQAYWQQGAGGRRGQSVVEIYNNKMHGRRVDFLCTLRGSANLVWSNSVTSGYSRSVVYLREEESTSSWSPSRTNWPAEDQVHNSFFWGNTINGTAVTSRDFITGDIPAFIQENRDYFVHEPQGTGGSESFTGANGASGSFPTDGIVYPTKGTMVFTASGPNAYFGYKPFTYPHPLVMQQLEPPSNLRSQN